LIFRNGRLLANEIAIPLNSQPTARDLKVAERSRQINIFTYCTSNINDLSIASIVGPRIAAVAALVGKDYEEGIFFM
jgi:hypothetical protein